MAGAWANDMEAFPIAYSTALDTYAIGTAVGDINIMWYSGLDPRLDTLAQAHAGPVTSLNFSPDGHYLASGGSDGVVRVWNMDTRKCVGVSKSGTSGAVIDLSFPAGDVVVDALYQDSSTKRWTVPTAGAREGALAPAATGPAAAPTAVPDHAQGRPPPAAPPQTTNTSPKVCLLFHPPSLIRCLPSLSPHQAALSYFVGLVESPEPVRLDQWLGAEVAAGHTLDVGIDGSAAIYSCVGSVGTTALQLAATAMIVDTSEAYQAASAALFFSATGICTLFCEDFPEFGVKTTFYFESSSADNELKQAARARRLKELQPALLLLQDAQERHAAGHISARHALKDRLAEVAKLVYVYGLWLCGFVRVV